MPNKASLIFLPDISGFTNFVNSTEVEHSQHIIAELLELLIDSQELDLVLAEIEGDAIFYYKHESVPSQETLMAQVKKMFVDFHTHLKQYEINRICDCGACCSASKLTLKFIAHAGQLDFINIKKERKPYGKEVIVAHRLMKNTVPVDDYLLLSQGVFEAWGTETVTANEGLTAISGVSEYDLGKVSYQYFVLSPLLKFVKSPPKFDVIPETKPFLKISELINHPVDRLFELITNFNLRHLWNTDADKFEFKKNRVNRVGEKHMCVVNNKNIEFETVSKNFGDDKKVYGEYTKNIPFVKEITTYFIVEKKKEKITTHHRSPPTQLKFFQEINAPSFEKRFF